MLKSLLSLINWVDLIVLSILLRTICLGWKRGFIKELLRFLGLIFTTFITLHFMPKLGQFLNHYFSVTVSYQNCIAYLFLWLMGHYTFLIIRDGLSLIFKIHIKSRLDNIAGLLLGSMRGLLIGGLMVILVYISGIKPLVQEAKQSTWGKFLGFLSLGIYFSSQAMVHTIFPQEGPNKSILDLQE